MGVMQLLIINVMYLDTKSWQLLGRTERLDGIVFFFLLIFRNTNA